jgi:DNA-binding SARP family transcriptional activator
MLRVRLFGGLALESEGVALPPPGGRRARELLGWLALHPGRHARAAVAARFWPDVLDASARASLRTTLHELRRALGREDAALVADRDGVALEAAWVDAREADALLATGDGAAALALAEAGELLAGLEEDWVLAARDALRERIAARLGALADAAEAAGDRSEAVRLSRAQVALDPLSEERSRALVRRLADAGDRAAAVGAYERLRDRLATHLRIAPSAETRALVAEVRAGPAPAGTAGVPAIVRRAGAGGGAFVGRDEPLARLLSALDAARHGERRLALVGGEPGIGKTRLVAELCARAHSAGATVLFGRCFEETIVPYQPFLEALGDSWPHDGPVAGDGADGARWRLFEAVDAALGAGAPTVLALDDLHWADKGTLLLLAHVVRSARPAALLLAGTYRESELSRTHPLAAALGDLRREGLYERIALGGLGPAAVALLVRGWLGSDDAAPRLYEETGGNPFFLEELVLHLREAGEAAGIPESVREVLGRRLSRLSDAANRTLASAAVVGRDFEVELLERLEPLGDVEVLDALEEGVAAQLLREDAVRPGRYGFAHPLVRETVYGELSLTRRVRLHGAVAEALERLHGDDPERLTELAAHRLAAVAGGDPGAAVEVALRAGHHCLAQLAYEDAAAMAARALEALDGSGADALHADVLLLLGEARLRCSDEPGAREAFARAAAIARTTRDAERLARAALGASGLGVTIIAVHEGAVELLREALAALPEHGALRARVLARLAIETYYVSTPGQRRELGDTAVSVARAAGDPAALIAALNARRVALWSAGALEERLETAAELVAAAERAGDVEGELQGRNWRVADLLELGEVDAARAEIDRHEALADRLRLPSYQWWAPMWRSTLALLAGRFDEAERLIAEFAAIGALAGDRNAALYVEVQETVIAMTGAALTPLDVALLERERDRPAGYAYRSGYSWYLAARGRHDEAREMVAWVAADDYTRLGDDMNRLAALAELAYAMALLGDPTHAAGAYERLAPYARRNVLNARGAAGYGSAALPLGLLAELLGDHDGAAAHFTAAIEQDAAMGADLWAERSRTALEALSRRSRSSSAPAARSPAR